MNSKTALVCCSCSWFLIIHEDRVRKNLALHASHNMSSQVLGLFPFPVQQGIVQYLIAYSEFHIFFREIATFISRLLSSNIIKCIGDFVINITGCAYAMAMTESLVQSSQSKYKSKNRTMLSSPIHRQWRRRGSGGYGGGGVDGDAASCDGNCVFPKASFGLQRAFFSSQKER